MARFHQTLHGICTTAVLTVLVALGPACSNESKESVEDHERAALEDGLQKPPLEEIKDDESGLLPAYANEQFTGDLPEMKKRETIRALVTLSKTDFFLDLGEPKGLQAELLREYETFVNKGASRRSLRTNVVFIPVTFDRLIPLLLEGKGDIAAAILTITPEREGLVAFTSGKVASVDELIVAHKDASPLQRIEDLSGKKVYVLRGSSYASHLEQLNEELKRKAQPPVVIQEADPNLLTEDILELVNAGVVEYSVADDYKVQLWDQVLPDLVVYPDLKLSQGGKVGWAVRKDNLELQENLLAFSKHVKKGTAVGNTLLRRYYKDAKWIKNPVSEQERKKLQRFMALFQKYGEMYGFDRLALAAQGYQESGLDHSVRSRRGAVGVMQLLPSTAADPNVGIKDIEKVDNNIHAAAKYMAFLRTRYFSDPEIEEEDRYALTWAAYNAGPSRVINLRNRAEKAGLDRNKWFGNVEHIALERVGQETVRYVANIYKYYVAYKLSHALVAEKSQIIGKS